MSRLGVHGGGLRRPGRGYALSALHIDLVLKLRKMSRLSIHRGFLRRSLLFQVLRLGGKERSTMLPSQSQEEPRFLCEGRLGRPGGGTALSALHIDQVLKLRKTSQLGIHRGFLRRSLLFQIQRDGETDRSTMLPSQSQEEPRLLCNERPGLPRGGTALSALHIDQVLKLRKMSRLSIHRGFLRRSLHVQVLRVGGTDRSATLPSQSKKEPRCLCDGRPGRPGGDTALSAFHIDQIADKSDFRKCTQHVSEKFISHIKIAKIAKGISAMNLNNMQSECSEYRSG